MPDLSFEYDLTPRTIKASLVHSFWIFNFASKGVFGVIGLVLMYTKFDSNPELEKLNEYGLYFIVLNIILIVIGKRIIDQNAKQSPWQKWTLSDSHLLGDSADGELLIEHSTLKKISIYKTGVKLQIEKKGKLWISIENQENHLEIQEYFSSLQKDLSSP